MQLQYGSLTLADYELHNIKKIQYIAIFLIAKYSELIIQQTC